MSFCTNDEGASDVWTYFLASGPAFAFLERREEVGQEILAKIPCGLNAKISPGISFEEGEIIGTQIPIFVIYPFLLRPAGATQARDYGETGWVNHFSSVIFHAI